MARTNNLTNFLTDVAGAIKTKKGSQTAIQAANFDTEILALPSQGVYQTKVITINENGQTVITPDSGYDAMDGVQVTTLVPEKQLQTKTYNFTQNTNIQLLPDSGYDGFDTVTLNINVPSSQINNQDKTITENGAYTADSGYTGLGTVTVNVPSGSGDVKLFDTVEHMQADPNPSEGDLAVVYRNEIQPVQEDSEFSSCIFPDTVVLDETFADEIYCSFISIDDSWFDGMVEMSSFHFRFEGYGESSEIIVEYESQDGMTYTRTDGGEELVEFGTTIKWEGYGEPFNNVIGNFMKIGGNYFEGLYEYKSNEYVMTKNQLNATPDYVYEKTFYSKNGVENGTLTTGVSNSFTDVNAEVYAKIQAQYNNMQPRILTDQDKDIDSDIRIIPSRSDGTPLLDTSNVTNMYDMFTYCKSLTSIPLLDTSNVTNMGGMFSSCSSLTTIPLLDTSNVTNMGDMFGNCSNLTSIPLLDTSNVTNMYDMFCGCSSLTTIPLLDTSNVTDMGGMFSSCSNLTTIPLIDTGNVTNMYDMFDGCSSLTTIPLLNTSNVTNMGDMFLSCPNLTTIPLIDTGNVTNMYGMFDNCPSLNNTSLNNILAMCANAAKITSNKTLYHIGLTEEQATTCQSLSNYSAFTTAGWTTGY